MMAGHDSWLVHNGQVSDHDALVVDMALINAGTTIVDDDLCWLTMVENYGGGDCGELVPPSALARTDWHLIVLQ